VFGRVSFTRAICARCQIADIFADRD